VGYGGFSDLLRSVRPTASPIIRTIRQRIMPRRMKTLRRRYPKSVGYGFATRPSLTYHFIVSIRGTPRSWKQGHDGQWEGEDRRETRQFPKFMHAVRARSNENVKQ
jgi:hypothetical protein